jgi:hypothetical protein
MATQIIKTVGSGGDYADLTTALAAVPSSLVSADEQWELRMLAGEHVLTAGVNFGSKTQDATRYIHLTANPGAEFWANTTNPLRYGYGARLRWTSGGDTSYGWLGNLRLGSYGRLSNLQLARDEFGGDVAAVVSATTGCRISRCLVAWISGGGNGACIAINGWSNVVANTIVARSGSDNGGTQLGIFGGSSTGGLTTANRIVNCLAVRTTDRTTNGYAYYGADVASGAVLSDVMALGNWSSACSKSSGFAWDSSSGRVVSSLADGSGNTAAPGTGNTFSITAASQIENLSSGATLDARLKSGFTSYTGQRNQSDTGDIDIYGTARSTSAPQIGAQESIPGGGSSINLSMVERNSITRGLNRGLS